MTDYDRSRDQSRYGQRHRYERGSNRQQEQFSDYDNDRYGDKSRYYPDRQSSPSYAAGSEMDGYDRNDRNRDDSFGSSQYSRSDYGDDRYQTQDRYSNPSSSDRYGSDRYSDVNPNRSDYGSRSGSSYGRSDYDRSRHGQSNYGQSGYGSGSSSRNFDRGYGNDHDRSRRDQQLNERGFFEKAGDEVASWFGDEDAERQRRMDHRGRGPANYERSNERLLEEACERLTNDWGVDASQINVTADDNEITLDGTVDSRSAKRRAEDCVHDVSGVRHVQNNLRVSEGDRYSGYSNTNSSTGSTNSLSDTKGAKTA
jgi:osmotically-inducible protein OsmY